MASKFWADTSDTEVVIDKNLYIPDFEYQFMKALNDENETLHPDMLYKAKGMGLRIARDGNGKKGADIYRYSGEEVVICEEPVNFLKEYADISDNKEKAQQKFREDIKRFKRLKLDKQPVLKYRDGKFETKMWTGKTIDGINLRPGNLNDDRADFKGIKMSDDNVHGLIAGRTGSGKSVYINALILSLITEYSPWELDLYLADFKKVELSRYMNDGDDANRHIAFTPHVKACAATSEIRYVISMIRHLVDCMNARNEFFTRLGVTKIQEFRDTYNVVLPRVLLIVDEFQQLFTEATGREAEEIQTLLNSITKLGRATGFHLIFASQEMSGTLRGNTLANFKIRMTLPCNKDISMDILGNSAAADLERGYVLVNTDSGNEIDNKRYRVPFIETEKKDDDEESGKTEFFKYLDNIKLESCNYDLTYKTNTQKFYREELQEAELGESANGERNGYLYDLDRIRDRKNAQIEGDPKLFDAVVLGKSVLYSEKKNDKVAFYIERGRNRGVMIASPNTDDIAKVRKLLFENFVRSEGSISHVGLELNRIVYARFPVDSFVRESRDRGITSQTYEELNQDDYFELLRSDYLLRKYSMEYLNDKKKSDMVAHGRELYSKLSEEAMDPETHKNWVERTQRRQSLKSELDDLRGRLTEKEVRGAVRMENPLIRCIDEVETMRFDKVQKIVIKGSTQYNHVVEALRKSENVEKTLNDCLEYLMAEKNKAEGAVKVQLTIFLMSLGYFKRRYVGEVPAETIVSGQAELIYDRYLKRIESFREHILNASADAAEKDDINTRIGDIIDELNELDSDELDGQTGALAGQLMDYLKYCFDNMREAKREKKAGYPELEILPGDSGIEIDVHYGDQDSDNCTRIENLCRECIKVFLKHEGKSTAVDYPKRIYWINGLDELDTIPRYLTDLIKDSLNYNILIVASITSELKDILMKKAFEYAFVTGNVEKLYSMFEVKYTRQPMDSIVVNFGVRSKGLNIPFKMYKQRELSEIETPSFVEDLLEG